MLRSNAARLIAGVIASLGAGVRHGEVPADVIEELRKNPYHSLHFAPHGGFERVLAQRGGNTYHAKPWRAKRLNQASAHARRRLGVA